MYRAQNGYRLVTVDTLYADIKDMIEQKFPRLDQDIIDDALAYARHQYTDVPLAYTDQQAENFFLSSVMERIHQRIKSEYNTLIELMLVRERHPRTPLSSDIAQDLTSGFISLPSRPIEMIAEKIAEISEENRKKLTPQLNRGFPADKYPIRVVPSFLSSDSDRINKFWSLRYKLQRQIIAIEQLTQDDSWTWDVFSTTWIPWRPDVKIKIFDEIYRLAQLNLNANVLERLIIDSVMRILDESSVSEKQRMNFIQSFENTINNQENRRYCRIYRENCHRLWKGY